MDILPLLLGRLGLSGWGDRASDLNQPPRPTVTFPRKLPMTQTRLPSRPVVEPDSDHGIAKGTQWVNFWVVPAGEVRWHDQDGGLAVTVGQWSPSARLHQVSSRESLPHIKAQDVRVYFERTLAKSPDSR